MTLTFMRFMRFMFLAFWRQDVTSHSPQTDWQAPTAELHGDRGSDINHEDHEGLEDGLGSIRTARTRVQHPCLLHDLHALHVSCFLETGRHQPPSVQAVVSCCSC
jgi:hypothetical protein